MLQCLPPITSNVWNKNGVIVSDVIISNKEVLDHFFSHHGFEISLIFIANNYLVLARELGGGDLFIGETLKVPPEIL